MRKKVKIIIEGSQDAYITYAENMAVITGKGDTAHDAKQSALDCIKKVKRLKSCPAILKADYSIVYKYDVQSLLNYYKGIISCVAIEQMTGINQKLIQHFASGLRKPKPVYAEKIEDALRTLGRELMTVKLHHK
jgi:hypothetical protein